MTSGASHPELREGSKIKNEISRKARNDKMGDDYKKSKMKIIKKSKIILLVIIIVVVIVLAVWAGILIAGMQSGTSPDGSSPYSAVYLSTGDIYFGKLSWFPSPHMTNVWFLERGQDQNGQPQIAVAPMKSVSWGPSDEVNFNSQDIVFFTRLKNSSQIVAAMENPSGAMSQGMVGNSIGAAPSASSSANGTIKK